jgi:AcrR family transcriptional regulator
MTAASHRNQPGQRRKRMPRAQRERQMIDVAVQLFSERGYVASSMDDIAERVGVSKPMLYEYFSSKEGLMLAAIRDARAQLREATQAAVAGATSGEQAVRDGLLAFFHFIEERKVAWSLLRHEVALMGPQAVAEIEAVRRQQTEFNMTVLRQFLPGVPALRLEGAAEFLVGACERVAVWFERHDDVTSEQAAELTMSLLWNGVAGVSRGDADR